MKKTILVFNFIFCSIIAFSQGTFSVSGKIMDGDSDVPMEYCTASLYNIEDSSLVSGNITNTKGQFEMLYLTEGTYYIEVSFIGFSPERTANFTLNNANPKQDIGTIVLSANAKLVNEVEVTAIRSTVKYEIDKKVVNVDKQIAASNGNAVDVLSTVPSVQVDINGDVKLRGSSGFQVLINGRPSILDGNDALQQIPASQIKNIEIITNPSAKYDAEGAGGIINIILKDEGQSGFSGVVNLKGGLWKNYGGDITMSYRTKKVVYTLSGDFNDRNMPRDFEAERRTTTDSTDFLTLTDGERAWRFQNYGVTGGVEYNPNENHSILVQGKWRHWGMLVDDDVDIENINLITDSTETYRNINDTERGGPNYQVAIDYQFKTKKKGTLSFHGSFNKNQFDEEVLNFKHDTDGIIYDGFKSTESGPGKRVRFNLDYEAKFGEHGKIEVGAMQQLRWGDEDVRSYELNNTGEYINQSQFNRTVHTKRHMRAFYGTYSNQWGKLGYQIGLRAEHTDRSIDIPAYDTEITVKRLDLFPTVHTSFDMNENNQFFASYAKRIRRPRPWFLQPTQIFLDPQTIFQGTPDILPTMTHNVEIGWLKRFKKNGSFTTEIYYRRALNVMEFTTLPYQNDIVSQQPQNVGNAHTIGAEAKVNFQPIKWWDVDVTGNLYNYKIKGTLAGFDFDNKQLSWTARVNNYFLITKTTKLQVEAQYQSKEAFSQGEKDGFFTLNAGFSQTFLKNALTLGIQARNLTGTAIDRTTRTQDNYSIYEKSTPKWPNLIFSLSYRINNYRPKRTKHFDSGVDY